MGGLMSKERDLSQVSIIFALGGPGSGKGTQCKRISEELHFYHLSMGDALREEAKKDPSLQGMLDKGELVDTSVVLNVLERGFDRALQETNKSRIIIDGFPRSMEQVTAFNERFDRECDVLLFLDVAESTMKERTAGRREDEKEGRADDSEEVARQRIKVFSEQTMSVIDYYESMGKVHRINGESDIDSVSQDIFALLTGKASSPVSGLRTPPPTAVAGQAARGFDDIQGGQKDDKEEEGGDEDEEEEEDKQDTENERQLQQQQDQLRQQHQEAQKDQQQADTQREEEHQRQLAELERQAEQLRLRKKERKAERQQRKKLRRQQEEAAERQRRQEERQRQQQQLQQQQTQQQAQQRKQQDEQQRWRELQREQQQRQEELREQREQRREEKQQEKQQPQQWQAAPGQQPEMRKISELENPPVDLPDANTAMPDEATALVTEQLAAMKFSGRDAERPGIGESEQPAQAELGQSPMPEQALDDVLEADIPAPDLEDLSFDPQAASEAAGHAEGKDLDWQTDASRAPLLNAAQQGIPGALPQRPAAGINVAICGGGNAAHVAAAMFASRGAHTRLFFSIKEECEKFEQACEEHGGVRARHEETGESFFGMPDVITTDPAEALSSADMILLALPANGHDWVLHQIKDHLPDSCAVGALPGHGCFEMLARSVFGDHMIRARGITIFSGSVLPWICRFQDYGKDSVILGEHRKVIVTAWPHPNTYQSENQPPASRRLQATLSLLTGGKTKFTVDRDQSSLLNSLWPETPLVHPALMYDLLRDYKGTVWHDKIPLLFGQCSEEAADLLARLSEETAAVVRVLSKHGVNLSRWKTLDEFMRQGYGDLIKDKSSIRSMIRSNMAYAGVEVPTRTAQGGFVPDFGARQLMEDVPHGLLAIRGMAEICGTPTAAMDEILLWAQKQMGREYLVDGKVCGRDVIRSGCPQRFGIKDMDMLTKGVMLGVEPDGARRRYA